MAKLTPRFGLKRWRKPVFWTLVALLILELPLTVAMLAFTGIADPDTYRDKLWGDGYENGFNSSPDSPLYAAANYQTSYKVPLVWSELYVLFPAYLPEINPLTCPLQPHKVQPRNRSSLHLYSSHKDRPRSHAYHVPHFQLPTSWPRDWAVCL